MESGFSEHIAKSIRLRKTDALLLRLLAEFHYLQPNHLQKLTGRNIVSLRRRLRQLWQAELVERKALPLERNLPIASPPDELVYYLSRKGVRLAQDWELADEHYRYNPEKRIALLFHDLLITAFHLTLFQASQKGSLKLTFWEQRRGQLQDSAQGDNEWLSVNPDALFGITNLTAPTGRNTSYYYLEMVVARQSEYENGRSNFLRKMEAYQAYARQGRHQDRWDFANFRVISITPTFQRALNLCQKLKEEGLGSTRFWFTHREAYSLEEPASVLSNIFITPRDYTEELNHAFDGSQKQLDQRGRPGNPIQNATH